MLTLVGAAYLVWLGLWRSYRTGLLTNVLNPKVAIFFLTFLPQFVDPSGPVAAQTGLLALVFIGLAAAWLLGYVAVLHLVRGVMSRPSVRQRVEQVSGVVLLGLGLRLAVDSA